MPRQGRRVHVAGDGKAEDCAESREESRIAVSATRPFVRRHSSVTPAWFSWCHRCRVVTRAEAALIVFLTMLGCKLHCKIHALLYYAHVWQGIALCSKGRGIAKRLAWNRKRNDFNRANRWIISLSRMLESRLRMESRLRVYYKIDDNAINANGWNRWLPAFDHRDSSHSSRNTTVSVTGNEYYRNCESLTDWIRPIDHSSLASNAEAIVQKYVVTIAKIRVSDQSDRSEKLAICDPPEGRRVLICIRNGAAYEIASARSKALCNSRRSRFSRFARFANGSPWGEPRRPNQSRSRPIGSISYLRYFRPRKEILRKSRGSNAVSAFNSVAGRWN